MRFLLITMIFTGALTSCNSTGEKLKKEFMQTARGEVGEIILVMDSAQYEGELGEEIKNTFKAYMVGLPQDEPMFSMSKVSPTKLNSVLKSATNMVFVMTLDSKTTQSKAIRNYFTNASLKTIQRNDSIFMKVSKDDFAKGQLVLYLFGQDEQQLKEQIIKNRLGLQQLFEKAARERIQAKILRQTEKEIMKSIKEDHDFSISVPFGWDLAKSLDDFVWIRLLDAEMEQNVFVYYEPYRSSDIFQDIGSFRDKITELRLRDSEKAEKYITRQDGIPVFTDVLNFDGKYAMRARGLWKINDNSGGGPFLSYTIVDEQQQRIYYIEGYVYSPGTRKKNLVREVDAILATFKTKTSDQNASL
ncbi:MAG: DUF4837 family protein [Cyclobacteriaceae bacterium]|nr:DUF4837 family protein [Cyclobacteriaceae bacterium HetDA_MAG_MS6]